MYKTRHKRPKEFDFDLIVLGTGAGGAAAHVAANAGKRVAVVEAGVIGGECPNFGCVPTKALLHSAEMYTAAQSGRQFGVRTTGVTFQYPAVKAWKDLAVERTGTIDGLHMYRHEGIKLIKGHGHFLNPWVISVNGHRFAAKKFLVATGTTSIIPPIPGLKETGFMTYRDAIDLVKLPKSIFVLGGGAIGCEFAHLFSSFGVKVHIADIAPRLVGAEDPEVGELIGALFDMRGIDVHTGVKVLDISKHGSMKKIFFEKDGVTHQVSVEEILVSSGKVPNTDMGLDNAGVVFDKFGVKVNAYMETNVKHIYAAGDVVGPYRFTHTATYQSRVAGHNMFHTKHKKAAHYRAVPRCLYTEPEVGCVGVTEKQLKDKNISYQVSAVPITVIGRANTSNVDAGFVKVIAAHDGTILGASIVSPRAGEMIHELTLAVNYRMKARQIAETIHAFPTWSEAVRIACQRLKSE